MPHSTDLTDFVVAARTMEIPVLSALAERFPRARLRVPLRTREGLRNRPEAALELGASLPSHRLRLDNGELAVPLFTNGKLCLECGEKLSWKTDGGALKTITLPGSAALTVLGELLVTPGIERVVLNPLSASELHLARTDVDAIASGKPLRSLWFYSRDGRLKRPVVVEGGSLLSSLLTTADRVLQRLTEPPALAPDIESGILERLPGDGPLSALAAEIVPLLEKERVGSLELAIAKTSEGVRVDATPRPSESLLARIREIAERHLSSSPGDASVKLTLGGSSVVLSSEESRPTSTRVEREKRASTPPPPPSYGYIPLEPESASDDDPRD
jgi:hypothetical protein